MNFLDKLLTALETAGANFTQLAYQAISTEIMPLLRIMLIAYIAWYGIQLMLGTARISASEVVLRVVRMTIIVAFIGQWGTFQVFFYDWLNDTPEDVGRLLLSKSGTGITEPTSGLSQIWKTANEAASAFAAQTGYFAILPSIVGGLIMLAVGLFIAVALAILVLSKVIMWGLLAIAPIFIACLMFENTRPYAMSWFQQVLTYAIMPLFVFVVAAFLITTMDAEVQKVVAASTKSEIKLSDIAAFLMICVAGAFVLFNIQTLAQGIAGGIATGIGSAVQKRTYGAIRFGINGSRATAGTIGNVGMAARKRTIAGMQENIRNSTAAQAMQKKIIENSTPK